MRFGKHLTNCAPWLLTLLVAAPFACARSNAATTAKPTLVAATSAAPAPAKAKPAPTKAPFPYVWGQAYHILPETHTDESGYFSIVEGKNGRVYVGTAKYNYNAFLVEFDPKTGTQKIVIDTNKLNGLTATGFASQSKIHTRNFVGPSGTVYCGSQEGYRTIPGDVSVYPGGYVMAYDPNTETARSLGMPMVGEGVIDVVADEARGLLYVVTSWGDDKKSHWMISDIQGKSWRELGPLPTDYASTLMDKDGKAHVITADSKLATYDPVTKAVSYEDITLKGKEWTRKSDGDIPTWQLTPDARSAYMVLMDAPDLYKIDLAGKKAGRAQVLGQMIKGTGYDSRASLSVAPDGRVYALYKVNNETKFGDGYLHHLTRYNPRTRLTEDLGVLAVRNPDFFDFGPRADGTRPPWSHGYHTLPDGVMTPLHGHQGLIATRDGNFYALILYPFTLLKLDSVNASAKATAKPAAQAVALTPSHQYAKFALRATDQVEKNIPELARVAEIVAQRHIDGGLLGFPWNAQPLQQELAGRAGGLMNIGFDRPWAGRTPEMDKQNVAIIGWDRAPNGGELGNLQAMKANGTYILGFGPRDLPELAPIVKICDAFFDTGLGADDRVVTLPDGTKAGRGNGIVNMLNGWAFTAEFISALTRKGHTPPIWKAFMYPDGREWMDKYFGKVQFQDDYKMPAMPQGQLTKAFLTEMRANIRRFDTTQNDKVVQAANLIVDEFKAGRKTIVSSMGHAPWTYVGAYEDKRWGTPFELESEVPNHVESYKNSREGALVLRLGYGGLDTKAADIYAGKKQRVILINVPDERPEFQHTQSAILNIDMGWTYGDATVSVPGYPIKLFPPSGIMQIVAYEAIDTEVLARLPKTDPPGLAP